MMKNFRENPIKTLDGSPVVKIRDYDTPVENDGKTGNKTTPGSAGSRAESPNTPPSTEASKSLFPVSGSRKKRRTALSKSASM